MSAPIHWYRTTADSSWDILLLGGVVMPGIPTVEVNLEGGLDVQKPRKGRGARIVDEGNPPSTISVTLQITTPDELDSLQNAMPVLRPRSKTAQRAPVEIVYPSVNFVGIENVVVSDVKLAPPNAKDGWLIEIKLIEWVPAPKPVKPLSKVPSGTATGAAAGAGGDAAGIEPPSKTAAPMTNLFSDLLNSLGGSDTPSGP